MSSAVRNQQKVSLNDLEKDDRGFALLSKLLLELTGIHLPLNEKNRFLLSSRLAKVMEKKGLSSYRQYYELICRERGEIQSEFVSRMTTNTTHFFREGSHFDFLRTAVPQIIQEKMKARMGSDLRMWCAASSTGQEVYTLLMTLEEAGFDFSGDRLKFLATDIDHQVLEKAAKGLYSQKAVKGLSKTHLLKFFNKVKFNEAKYQDDLSYEIKDKWACKVRFAPFNLLTSAYSFQFQFDVIFCRNVLIYFRAEEIERVVASLTKNLRKGGYLFVGHSESGSIRSPHLKSVSHSVYRKVR